MSSAGTTEDPEDAALGNRQVVGWWMKPHMRRELVTDALHMAWFRRRPEAGLIFHGDRGSQHCSADFQKSLTEYHMSLAYVSPMQFETAWLAAQQRQAA